MEDLTGERIVAKGGGIAATGRCRRAALRSLTAAAGLLLGLMAPAAWSAEYVSFNSMAIAPSPLKARLAKARGIRLAPTPGIRLIGRLSRPTAADRAPAVVVLHDCAGIQRYHNDWARRLTSWGYVVLQVDSLKTRHRGADCAEPLDIASDQLFDAHGALAYLRGLNAVDAERIAVIGWSFAGNAALNGLNQFGGQALLQYRFQAGVAFYPYCEIDGGIFLAPVLILIGAADQLARPDYCRRLVAVVQARSAPIELKLYDGVQHGFDNPALGANHFAADVWNPNRDPQRGVTKGYERAAHQDSIDRVKAFLARHMN